jgi:Leucine-rich repeat (LRR) protein
MKHGMFALLNLSNTLTMSKFKTTALALSSFLLALIYPLHDTAQAVGTSKTFMEWCNAYKNPGTPEASQRTVAELVAFAATKGAKDCKSANTILSKVTSLKFATFGIDAINKPTYEKDITPLASLPNLREITVTVSSDKFNGLGILKNLKYLKVITIDASVMSISSLAPISNLGNLERLEINGIVGNTSDISKMKKLKHVSITRAGIIDTSSFSALTNLQFLDLSYNKINDVRPLAKLTKLKSLDIFGNEVTNIDSLSTLKNLKMLIVGSNRITKKVCPVFESVCKWG